VASNALLKIHFVAGLEEAGTSAERPPYASRRPLFLLLAGRPLALALGVDFGRERVLEAQGHDVHEEHPECQREAGWLGKEKRGAQEAHRGAPVHGRTDDVEWEPGDHLVHEDAKVIAQKGAGDAEAPCRRDDKRVAEGDEGVGRGLGVDARQQWVRGLLANGGLVEEVAEEAEREDGRGETVAGCAGASAKQVREKLVVVLCKINGLAMVASKRCKEAHLDERQCSRRSG